MVLTQSVRAKLFGIVIMLSGVAALLGVLGWNRMGSINARLETIVEETSTAQVLATRVRVALMGVHRAEKNLLLAESPEVFEEYMGNLTENRAELLGRLDELEKLCEGDELSRVAAFRRTFGEFLEVSDEVVDLARQNSNTQAASLSATRGLELYRAAAAPIEQIAEETEQRATRLLEELSSRADEADKALIAEVADASMAVQRSGRIVQDLLRIQRAEKNYILATDPAEMDEYDAMIREAVASVHERRERLASLLDAEARTRLDEFVRGFEAWMALNGRILSLSREATNTRAAELSRTDGRALFDTAAEEMRLIAAAMDEEMIAQSAAADRAFASATVMMLTSALCGILVASIIAVVVVNKIIKTLSAVVVRMRAIAAGDLTGESIPVMSKDEIGQLAEATNEMQRGLREIVAGISSNAEQVSAAATEVAATSEQMAASSDHQRAQLTQVAAAIEEMAATITEVSGRAGEVSRQSTEAGGQATEGGEIVRQTVDEIGMIAGQVESTSAAVGQLSEKAVQIGEILTVINDIADQTNLLALNAAIEAARAGEHGRGFAVVADEVRKLAERTQEATQEVSRSIGEIQTSTGDATEMMAASRERVTGGVDLARRAGQSLESIVKGSTTVAQSIDSIASAVEEQSATTTELARSVEVISASADEATQGANQAAAAATQLSGNAETLRELVSRFRF
jgi:methyl-accepting chemotaxis protein